MEEVKKFSSIQSWILTFNRPHALNRQLHALDWTQVNVFSNHPDIGLDEENTKDYNEGKIKLHYNTLSSPEATSYCARSWNSIFLKCFKDHDEAIFIQDDTYITNPNAFQVMIQNNRDKYDLIWGPAGDQFFYMKKSVLQKVGWFDERFCTGCFCGDADWLKRAYRALDKDKISVYEKHDWGFVINPIGVEHIIPTDIGSKAVDPTYVNQHQETQKLFRNEECVRYAQQWWENKWGHPLNGSSMIQHINPPRYPELFLYPWFTTKYLGIDGIPKWCKTENEL